MLAVKASLRIMSNKQIKKLLHTLEQDIHIANSSEQILRAVSKVKAYGKPLVYAHSKHYLAATLAFSIALLIFAGSHFKWQGFNNGLSELNAMFVIAIVCFAAGLLLLFLSFKDKKHASDLAKMIFQKDALLDNQLKHKRPLNIDEMQIRCSECNRGNHLRTFKETLGGEFTGDEHSFKDDYYQFHYVNKRTVTQMQGKRLRTKTVYDKYDRYGLLIPFAYFKNIQIYSFNLERLHRHRLTTGSIAFDKLFKVNAADELLATRFLKPAVVLAIVDMASFLSKMNIEIDATGLMCLSFKDSNMIMGNQRYDLSKPDAFYDELAGITKLRLLERTLRFVHQLLKHSDSNFKETT